MAKVKSVIDMVLSWLTKQITWVAFTFWLLGQFVFYVVLSLDFRELIKTEMINEEEATLVSLTNRSLSLSDSPLCNSSITPTTTTQVSLIYEWILNIQVIVFAIHNNLHTNLLYQVPYLSHQLYILQWEHF